MDMNRSINIRYSLGRNNADGRIHSCSEDSYIFDYDLANRRFVIRGAEMAFVLINSEFQANVYITGHSTGVHRGPQIDWWGEEPVGMDVEYFRMHQDDYYAIMLSVALGLDFDWYVPSSHILHRAFRLFSAYSHREPFEGKNVYGTVSDYLEMHRGGGIKVNMPEQQAVFMKYSIHSAPELTSMVRPKDEHATVFLHWFSVNRGMHYLDSGLNISKDMPGLIQRLDYLLSYLPKIYAKMDGDATKTEGPEGTSLTPVLLAVGGVVASLANTDAKVDKLVDNMYGTLPPL